MLVTDTKPMPMRDVFLLLSSAILAWSSVKSWSSLLCRKWLADRIRKTKTMKKSSGVNGSFLSKGKQSRNSEGSSPISKLHKYDGLTCIY